jgi:ribonucleoside-diphosphate reductase beta chain
LVTYVINNNYNNKIQGATRIIKLINFDEDIHTSMVSGTIQILKKTKSEGFSELINSEWFNNMATKTFLDVLKDELEFYDYLASFGDIPTLTKRVVEDFMKYFVDDRLASIGVKKPFNQIKTDTVQYFEGEKDMNSANVAQQESDMAIYSIGIMKNDIPDGILKPYKRKSLEELVLIEKYKQDSGRI